MSTSSNLLWKTRGDENIINYEEKAFYFDLYSEIVPIAINVKDVPCLSYIVVKLDLS